MIPLSSQIEVFEVQDPPKIVPKIVQKMKLKADPPNPPFLGSWSPQDRNKRPKGLQKGPPWEAKVEPRWQKKTSKRVLKYALYPKGAPSGSDGLWRAAFEAIWG